MSVVEQPVDLDLIPAAVHHNCMGLPQELVDHIMEMLHYDHRSLEACFVEFHASTLRLIRRTLSLNPWSDQSVLALEESLRYLRWDSRYRAPLVVQRGFV